MANLNDVVGKIVGACATSGLDVSDSLASFLVKTIALNSENGFDVSRKLTEKDVSRLSELVLKELAAKSSVCLDTIKSQIYFAEEYTSRDDVLERIQRAQENQLSRLRTELLACRARSSEDHSALYGQVISYMLQSSGMGSRADGIIIGEVEAALRSVFPPSNLGTFLKLLQSDKERQLKELATVVVGIWLFNRTSRKSPKEAILRELLSASRQDTSLFTCEEVEKELMTAQRSVWKHTAVLEKMTRGVRDASEGGAVSPVLLRHALYNVRQQERFLKLLLADARVSIQHAEELQRQLWSQLELLNKTVQTVKSVPTTKVFPLFKILSKLWSGLREEAEVLSACSRVMSKLRSFCTSGVQIFFDADLDGSEERTDAQRLMDSSGDCIDPEQMEDQEWLLPGTTGGYSDQPLQFSGFCGYSLVTSDGLLLPGNPSIGVLKHMNKFYAFSSRDAARLFARRPSYFISEVEEKAKRSPELIRLLQLDLLSSGHRVESRCEMGTQTDVHPVEAHVDRAYHWNEWELRRRAIQLTDLRTKVTHSAQTSNSHMRRENCSQTWRVKENCSQTRRDGHSNVPRPQVYLAGVRGHRVGGVEKVNLTRCVED
ncbi:cilia- and flagella-associated protein 206-like [Synchiropus splendidus]|uniref:cilia- and flagella-associated protein 206-like n=1 Tax=Synchiropus splendidus TaxID=270530 RepID=UPI00237D7B92|nr:cilia- and flagella-associated protein 206-like [Synchiropus splendidus]